MKQDCAHVNHSTDLPFKIMDTDNVLIIKAVYSTLVYMVKLAVVYMAHTV